MGGSTDTFIALAQGLEDNLKKATKELKSFNDHSQAINKSFSTTNKELAKTENVSQKVNDTFDSINRSSDETYESTKKWGLSLDTVKRHAKGILSIFTAGIAGFGFVEAIAGAVELHQNMTDLSYQMGQGAKGARQLENSVMGIQAATGQALDKIIPMVTTLTEMKVPLANMKQLATDSLLFSEITGASADAVAQMTGKLTTMGGLGQKSISAMLGNMVQVQRAFGMSKSAVTELTNNITDTTVTLRNMGKSAGEIEKFTKGTVKLAGAFASVGLEAKSAADLVERLLDPGQLEDNALLYAKLGISIEDAISGNIDPAKMTAGLQGLGKELQNMSGPQASAMAKALGVPLGQLRQMGNMDMSEIQKTFGSLTGSSETLTKAQSDQATAQRDISQAWEKIKGTIGNIVIKLMPVFDVIAKAINNSVGGILNWVNKIVNAGFIEKFINKMVSGIQFIVKLFSSINPKVLLIGLLAVVGGFMLYKTRLASINTDSAKETRTIYKRMSVEMGNDISKGISAGLDMASEKGGAIFEAKMKQRSRAVSSDLQNRIERGHEYAAISASAKYQELLGGQNTFKWAKSLNKSTGEWLDKIKEGGKPISSLTTFYERTQDAIKEKIELSKVDYQNERSFINLRLDAEKASAVAMQERIKHLTEIGDKGKLSVEQGWELERLGKDLGENSKRQLKYNTEINDLGAKATEMTWKYVEKLAPDELRIYREKLSSEKDSLEARKISMEKRDAEIAIEAKILSASKTILETERMNLEYAIEKGDASAEEVDKLKQVRKALADNAEMAAEGAAELVQNKNEAEKLHEELIKVGKDLAHAEETSKKIGIGDNADIKSFGQKIKDAAKGATGVISAGFTDVGEKFTKSMKNAGKALKQSMSLGNIIASLRKAGDGSLFKGLLVTAGKIGKLVGGAGRGMGNIAKGIGAMGGGLLMAGVMKSDKGQELIARVQEKLGEIMTDVMKSLMPLVESLIPIVMDIVTALMPLVRILLPPLLKVLSIILRVLGEVISAIGSMLVGLGKIFPALAPIGEAMQKVGNGIVDASKKVADAADRMAKESNKLSSELTKAVKQEIISSNAEKSGNEIRHTLSEETRLSKEQINKGTVQDILLGIQSKDLQEKLATELRNNTLAVAASARDAKTKALEERAKAEIEIMKGKEFQKGVSVLTSKQFGGAGVTREELLAFLKSSGFGPDSVIGKAFISDVKGSKETEQAQMARLISDLSSINSTRVQSSLTRDGVRLSQASVDSDVLKTLFGNTFQQLATASGYKGSTVVEGTDTIESIKKGLLSSTSDPKLRAEMENLFKELSASILGKSGDGIEKAYAATLEKNASKSQSLLANLVSGMLKIGKKVDYVAGDGSSGESATSPEGIVTKLYPAILEATSSSWVKTQDATAVTSGGTPEERTAAAAEVTNSLLQELIKINGLSAESAAKLEQTTKEGIAARKVTGIPE